MSNKQYFEYRGVSNAVYAEVIQDDATAFVTGTVKDFTGVSEIAKTTESSNEPHYYDNIPAIIVSSTGADEITINASGIPFSILSEITGQYYDETSGMFVEQERTPAMFAFGYITQKTDGTSVLVWRLKGSFSIPDLTSVTQDDGTDANGQELTYTGISTTHKFTANSAPAKAVNIDTSVNTSMTSDTFFSVVQTPDTIGAAFTPSVTLDESTLSVTAGETETLTATVVPTGATVTWVSSDTSKATVADGVVTGVAAGSAVIIAAITVEGTTYTDTCTVTVTAS